MLQVTSGEGALTGSPQNPSLQGLLGHWAGETWVYPLEQGPQPRSPFSQVNDLLQDWVVLFTPVCVCTPLYCPFHYVPPRL